MNCQDAIIILDASNPVAQKQLSKTRHSKQVKIYIEESLTIDDQLHTTNFDGGQALIKFASVYDNGEVGNFIGYKFDGENVVLNEDCLNCGGFEDYDFFSGMYKFELENHTASTKIIIRLIVD